MLAAGVLRLELARFADLGDAVFTGWPTSRQAARRRWAHAFAVYVADAVDTTPVLSPPGVTLAFSAVEDAVFAELGLANPTVEAAADDLAGAWRSGIQALTAGSAATDPATATSFTFAAMDPIAVAARFTTLRGALITAFRTRSATRDLDLAQIADALHTATSGLRSTLTPFVVIYG